VAGLRRPPVDVDDSQAGVFHRTPGRYDSHKRNVVTKNHEVQALESSDRRR
jgi:hypothetical protein